MVLIRADGRVGVVVLDVMIQVESLVDKVDGTSLTRARCIHIRVRTRNNDAGKDVVAFVDVSIPRSYAFLLLQTPSAIWFFRNVRAPVI